MAIKQKPVLVVRRITRRARNSLPGGSLLVAPAFDRRPLLRAYRPFVGQIFNGSSGSIPLTSPVCWRRQDQQRGLQRGKAGPFFDENHRPSSESCRAGAM